MLETQYYNYNYNQLPDNLDITIHNFNYQKLIYKYVKIYLIENIMKENFIKIQWKYILVYYRIFLHI